eukprot:7244479-Alexandrium_andersonii.AAC.1
MIFCLKAASCTEKTLFSTERPCLEAEGAPNWPPSPPVPEGPFGANHEALGAKLGLSVHKTIGRHWGVLTG